MIFLSSARDFIALHSPRDRLEYLISALESSNNSFSTWLKKTHDQDDLEMIVTYISS